MKLQRIAENNGLSAFQRFLQFFIPPYKMGVGCRFLILCKGITNNGRFIIANFKRSTQRFYIFRVVLRFCVGLFCWLSPLQVLAEFTATDSDNLFLIKENTEGLEFKVISIASGVSSISTDVPHIRTEIGNIKSGLGYSGGYDTLKFDLQTVRNYQAANGTLLAGIMKGLGSQSQTTWYGETIGEKLDRIITAIESLDNSGGSGSETPEIPSDIATETTLSAFKGQYEQLSNQFLNSWGFSQELTLSNYLSNTFNPTQFTIYAPQIQHRGGAQYQEPFPGSTDRWGNLISQSYTFQSQGSFLGNLFLGLSNLEIKSREVDLYWRKKQAWNDWQAHTNMVAQIVKQVDRIVLPPEDGRQDSTFNPETGTIETPSYGSSSAETVNLKPSYTNDFAQIEQSSETVINSFDFLKSDEIKNRYISDNMLNMGEFRDYGSVGTGFNGIWKIGDFVIDFSNSNTYYREIISINTLSIVRNSMSYIWTFCAILGAFWFVIKIGGISQD